MIAQILVIAVALLHFYFLFLEMFRWTAPKTRAAFGTTEDFAKASKVLAANQGLYNGFLASGLLFSLWARDGLAAVFCLACVIVAGVYGAITVSRKILFIQALPAGVAMAALLMGI